MIRKLPYRISLFFLLFFLFQWGGQFAALMASRGEKKLIFLLLLYTLFILRGFIWLFILRDMKLGLAYSLSSLGYLIIPLLSLVILGEPFKENYIPGGLLILAGISLYGRAEQRLSVSQRENPL